MHYRMIPVARIALTTFVNENLAALCSAATLLGGPQATRRVLELSQDLLDPVPLSARLCRELEWLEGLLTLEHVHDLDSGESAYFAMIDPATPVVAEICLLTDEYCDRLASLRDEEPQAFQAPLKAA